MPLSGLSESEKWVALRESGGEFVFSPSSVTGLESRTQSFTFDVGRVFLVVLRKLNIKRIDSKPSMKSVYQVLRGDEINKGRSGEGRCPRVRKRYNY